MDAVNETSRNKYRSEVYLCIESGGMNNDSFNVCDVLVVFQSLQEIVSHRIQRNGQSHQPFVTVQPSRTG